MVFLKAKYCVPFFMLVLLTSGVPLNASNDGDILPIADAAVQTKNNGNKIFFCENNPIQKTEFDKPHMKPQDYMAKCKERTEGYSWGSRIYVLLWAPGFNADDKKISKLVKKLLHCPKMQFRPPKIAAVPKTPIVDNAIFGGKKFE